VGGQVQLPGGQPNAGVGGNVEVGNNPNTSGNQNVNQPPNNQQPNNQQLAATNAFPPSTGTNNQTGDANGTLTPTTQPGATNRVYATNSMGLSNSAPWLQRDQAITPQDQALLLQIRQAVFPPSQQLTPWMSSIHFILKDGAVRLVGNVPTPEERQRIEALVTQIPGVVRVYDAITVSPAGGFGAGAGAANGSANAGGAVNGTVPPANVGTTNAPGTVLVPQ
jgi:hypothetical protein